MATKITLLRAFASGNAAGDISTYTAYPTDHDTNYLAIETTVNQLIDEVSAALIPNTLIQTDLIDHRNIDLVTSGARYRQDDWVITFTGTTVTIGAGKVFIKGNRFNFLTPQVTDLSALSNDTYQIPIDATGNVLPPTTSTNSAFFDVVSVVFDGSIAEADVTDNLFNAGQSLTNTDSGFVQGLTDAPNTVIDPFNVDYPHRLNPPIRYASSAGVVGDSGFFTGPDVGDDRWFWVSQRDGGAGSGDTVLGANLTELGQVLLLEQARVVATATAESAGVSGSLAALSFDAAERREPASYFTNPWFTPTGSTFTQPGATTDERDNFIGTYMFSGFVEFPDAGSTGPFLVDVVAEGVTVFNARVAKVTGGITTVAIAGLFELSDNGANTIQVRTAHSAAGALNVDARFGFHLIGGRA